MLKRKYTKQQIPRLSRRKLRTKRTEVGSEEPHEDYEDLKDIGDAVGVKLTPDRILLRDEFD